MEPVVVSHPMLQVEVEQPDRLGRCAVRLRILESLTADGSGVYRVVEAGQVELHPPETVKNGETPAMQIAQGPAA